MTKETKQFTHSQEEWDEAFVHFVNTKYGNLKLSDLETMNDPVSTIKNYLKTGRRP